MEKKRFSIHKNTDGDAWINYGAYDHEDERKVTINLNTFQPSDKNYTIQIKFDESRSMSDNIDSIKFFNVDNDNLEFEIPEIEAKELYFIGEVFKRIADYFEVNDKTIENIDH